MTWARFADDMPDHPKVIAVGPLGAWMFVCSVTWSNRYLTDGFIPSGVVRRLADVDEPARLAIRLVEVGLWERADGGYRIHDYADYQPSAESVRHERAENARRMREWRERQKYVRSASPTDDASNGVSDAGSVRSPDPDPVKYPDPVRLTPTPFPPSPDEGKGERRKSRRRRGDGIRGEDVTAPPPEVTISAPPSPGDRELWNLARERLRSDMTPANWDLLIGSLDLVGRTSAGGFCLQAPPGQGIAGRVAPVVKRALYDAGDPEAASVTIVERGAEAT
jgi:hypothetical protein